tara:strand:- start:2186 stop:3865 length:1680 start_codon:yes stop_codon:yes gene_type:complete
MKSLSQFIIETQSGNNKPSSDPWFSDEDKNGKNKSGNKKNVSGNKNDSSKKNVNSKKNRSSNKNTGKTPRVDNSQQMRGIEGDKKSNEIRRGIEAQTNTKTREFTQKDGVTKGNDSASINRRLSAGTTKGDQLTRAYGTAGTSGDSNSGAGADTLRSKPSPPKVSSSDVEMLKKTNIKSGGKVTVNYAEPPKSGQDKLLDKIFKSKNTGEKEFTKAVLDRPSNKGPVNPRTGSRIPDATKGELGKLYKTSTKADPKRGGSVRTTDKITAELSAKRKARINPTTGKATPKGVENFAINQQTKGLSTKGDAGKQAMANAKKIASDNTSKAYKDIETKINTSDYAGKRAKLASTKELDKIAKDLKTSPTISGKAPSAIKQSLSPSKLSIKGNLPTKGGGSTFRKGKIVKPGALTYKGFADKASKSKFKLPKITPKGLASKAVAPAFAVWNAVDNYKTAKGSPLRKLAKSAFKTSAYYAGATAGGTVGTAAGSFTGPGAFVTGTVSALAGGQTASNLADKAFNKIWKPPTTKGKGKGGGVVGGSGDSKPFKWKSGISIGSSKK